MISRFINIFKTSDRDEQLAFQKRVLSIINELHPDRSCFASEDPLLLDLDGLKMGLTNLRANFLLTTQTDSDLQELTETHVKNLTDGIAEAEKRGKNWDDVTSKLMPQLMPSAFLEDLDLVSFPFGGGVVVGFVVDAETSYTYVLESDLEQWDVTKTEVYETALQNLDDRSDGIEFSEAPCPNGLFVVNSMDGFDAVRIIWSSLRIRCAEMIGSPFYFGVPNRDFLICWSKNDDVGFQERMKAQIGNDFEERPYPLSPWVFETDEDGEFREVRSGSIDPTKHLKANN